MTDAMLTAKDIHFSYGEFTVLDGVSFEIHAGEHVALTGANGSGKSTLLAIIAGVLEPDSGEVISNFDKEPAFVIQQPRFSEQIPLTVEQAVRMGRWADRGSLGRLKAADKEIVEEAMTQTGIQSLRNRQIAELSGGQKQRVLLAQGIAQRSPLLLLDEPAAGLDAESEMHMTAMITELAESGVAIIQATHDHDVAESAGRILHLKSGNLNERV